MAKLAVGDAVRLTREVEICPAGTVGTVERVDDNGWIKVTLDSSRAGRFIMTREWDGDLEKVEEVNDGEKLS